MKPVLRPDALVVDLGSVQRCLSSAVLGGGLGTARCWLDLQVAPDYARVDPEAHLREAADGLPGPVVGMLTAADVSRYTDSAIGAARAFATVGVAHPLAAAGRRPRLVPAVGTINLLVVVTEPLTDAGLAGALQTAVEAKAQALADAGIVAANARGPATGTATDSLCVACPPGQNVPFAGPATTVGAAVARAVHGAVLAGARADRAARPGDARRAGAGSPATVAAGAQRRCGGTHGGVR